MRTTSKTNYGTRTPDKCGQSKTLDANTRRKSVINFFVAKTKSERYLIVRGSDLTLTEAVVYGHYFLDESITVNKIDSLTALKYVVVANASIVDLDDKGAIIE
jgi:hypothetical protein